MIYNRVAFRYAKALLLSCEDNASSKAVFDDMSLIKETFNQSEELKLFIDSKVVKDSDKLSTLNTIFNDLNKLSKSLI